MLFRRQQYRISLFDLPRAPLREAPTCDCGLRFHVLEAASKIVGKVEFVLEPGSGESENQHE